MESSIELFGTAAVGDDFATSKFDSAREHKLLKPTNAVNQSSSLPSGVP